MYPLAVRTGLEKIIIALEGHRSGALVSELHEPPSGGTRLTPSVSSHQLAAARRRPSANGPAAS